MNYRIQHESIPLTEEKRLLREIKQLEGTREKVIANAATRAKLQDTMLQKEALQDQVKVQQSCNYNLFLSSCFSVSFGVDNLLQILILLLFT